jgi:prepilin-type N-terminal cleavage/methylation domain-containing protein
MNRTTTDRLRRGFTLIELLLVMAIIVILMGLLMSGIAKARQQGELQRGRAQMAILVAAFQAYYADYATWPWAETGEDSYPVDARVVRLLQGVDERGGTPNLQGNDRLRTYLETKSIQTNSAGAFADPWGNAYQAVFDADRGEVIPNPFGPAGSSNRVPFLVWSKGPNGTSDSNGEMSDANKDNLRSN